MRLLELQQGQREQVEELVLELLQQEQQLEQRPLVLRTPQLVQPLVRQIAHLLYEFFRPHLFQ
jgi:hypothetical protein